MNKNSLEKYKQELAKAAFCAMKESADKYKRDLENYNQEVRSAGFSSRISGSMVTNLANELSKDSDGLLNLANRNGIAMGAISPVALAFSHRYTAASTTCYMVNPFDKGNKPEACTAFMYDESYTMPSENTYKTEW